MFHGHHDTQTVLTMCNPSQMLAGKSMFSDGCIQEGDCYPFWKCTLVKSFTIEQYNLNMYSNSMPNYLPKHAYSNILNIQTRLLI